MDNVESVDPECVLREAVHFAEHCRDRSAAGLKKIESLPEGPTKDALSAMLKTDAETAAADVLRLKAALSKLEVHP